MLFLIPNNSCFFFESKCHDRLLPVTLYLLFCLRLLSHRHHCPMCLCAYVATLLWGKCEDETHTSEIRTWESSGTPEIWQFNYRGQNTLHSGVLYVIGKLLKFRCRKWPRLGHLNFCNISYGKKKGWESNWQFDSRPLKVGNRPDPGACKWSEIHPWKTFEESYNFALDLIPIEGLSKKLWSCKVPGVQTGTVSRLLLGNPGTKSHLDVGATEKHRVYYMGEGGGFLRVRAVVSQVSLELPVACPSTKGVPESELTIVGWFDVGSSKWITCHSS